MIQIGKTKYINSAGKLSRRDDSILFRKGDKNIYIPVENTKEIFCLGEVELNSSFLSFMSQSSITIHFFNYYGYYAGTFYPKEYLLSGKVSVKQVEAFNSYRLPIAKAVVNGIRENIIVVLEHYYRHGKKDLKENLDYLRATAKENIEKSYDIKSLLNAEGNIWHEFYSTFNKILPDDFIFNKRVKRPPDNPINAMISFGNSILYAKTVTAIYHTHLNQSVSFLHEPSEGRFSLSLDISEVFKPIIVFKTIFELVNNKKIKVEKHFEKKLNYCILNEEGRAIFVDALEKRLESKREHPRLKRKVSMNTLIKLDGYKLLKTVLEGKEFIPYNYKAGV